MIDVSDLNAVHRGRIAEHVVAQELRARNPLVNDKTVFWVRERGTANAEVDFVVQHGGLLIPLEVKSGPVGRLRSLHAFIDRAPHDYAVRLSAGEFSVERVKTVQGKEFKLMNLQYYVAGRIDQYLDWFVG